MVVDIPVVVVAVVVVVVVGFVAGSVGPLPSQGYVSYLNQLGKGVAVRCPCSSPSGHLCLAFCQLTWLVNLVMVGLFVGRLEMTSGIVAVRQFGIVGLLSNEKHRSIGLVSCPSQYKAQLSGVNTVYVYPIHTHKLIESRVPLHTCALRQLFYCFNGQQQHRFPFQSC